MTRSSHLSLPCFAHIPSTSFLYALPAGFASRNENDIEINAFFMDTVFGKPLTSRSLITGSVCSLHAKSSSSKDEESWRQLLYFFVCFFPNLFFFLRFDTSVHYFWDLLGRLNTESTTKIPF